MTKVTRVCLWFALYVDIDGDIIDYDMVEEAFCKQYGNSRSIMIDIDYLPDWETVDEWEIDDE
jgi:hypothetical protein